MNSTRPVSTSAASRKRLRRHVVARKAPEPAAETAAFAAAWGERAYSGAMSEADLHRAPLAVLLMHGLAFEEGTPVMSILIAAKERIDSWDMVADGTGVMELPRTAIENLRRMIEVAIELDRRAMFARPR